MAAGSGGRHYERMLAAMINLFAARNNINIECEDPAGSDKNAKDIRINTQGQPLCIEVKNSIGERGEFGQFQIQWSNNAWSFKSGKNAELSQKILDAIRPRLPNAFDFTTFNFSVANSLRRQWLGSYFPQNSYGGFDVVFVNATEVGLSSVDLIETYYAGNDGIQIDGYGLYGLNNRIPVGFADAQPQVSIKFRVKYHGGYRRGRPTYSFTVAPTLFSLQRSTMDLENDETLKKLFLLDRS